MSNKHIADGEAAFSAVSSTPDCCEVGGSVVPFDSYQSLDRLKAYPASMTARGKPVLNVGSVIEGTQGNAGAGVVSGTSLGSGDCEITSGSPTVSLEGKPVARHGSDVAMNNNNCVGKLVTTVGSPDGEMLHNRLPCNNPPVSSPLLEELQKRKAQTAVVSEVLDKGREMMDFSKNINELDKKAEEAIKGIRPEKMDDRFMFADTVNDMRETGAGVGRGALHFVRSLASGAASLGNMAGQGMYKVKTFLYDPATYLDSAILAENMRLGNVCMEGMKEEAKKQLEESKKAAKAAVGKIWDENVEKWEKGTIGDKAEVITRVGLEVVTLPLAALKAGMLGKLSQLGKITGIKKLEVVKAAETATDAAKATQKSGGTDGLHVKGNNAKGAALGEKRAHEVMQEKGMEPMGKTDGIYRPGETGIDGVYKNSSPPPDYIITEAKYNTSKLNKGLADGTNQMSDDWIRKRLDKHVSRDEAMKIREAMDQGRVERWKIQVKPDGTTRINKIDRAGDVIKGNAGKVD